MAVNLHQRSLAAKAANVTDACPLLLTKKKKTNSRMSKNKK